MPPQRGEISPGALLSAVVKKDEALMVQVWSRASKSIRGMGSSPASSPAQRVVDERGHGDFF